MQELAFLAVVGFMFVHELDAVQRHEWRVFPVLNRLPDHFGYHFFCWAHVPIFLAVIWFGYVDIGSGYFRIGFATFAIVHVALHIAFTRHPAYEFNNLSSQLLIWSAGLSGVAYNWMAL